MATTKKATRKATAKKSTKKTAPKAEKKAAPKKTAKQPVDRIAAFKAKYPHVVEVTQISTKGTPARVIIRCTEDGCKETREIASQDAFQVKRCHAHQREHQKARRRSKKS